MRADGHDGPVITLYLHGTVATGPRELEAFLARARPVYEELGGIRVRLQWSVTAPGEFVEIMEYADRAAYDADQVRVEADPRMRALIAEWRTHLAGPPRVEAYEEVAVG